MGALLNLIGLSAAIALYAMLLVMVVRARRAPLSRAQSDPLLVATALLGLLWNLCALPAFALTRLGLATAVPMLTLVGTSALGFLPAVVVHSVLRGGRGAGQRRLAHGLLAGAYGAATIAAALHVRAMWLGLPLPSPTGMRLLTVVFIALFVPVAWVTRGQQRSRRALWVAALSAFAVSALHLSQVDPANPSWFIELLGHHASLPLAIAILYQDFPFALADLFLKRVLTLVALLAIPLIAVAAIDTRLSALPVSDPRVVASLVGLWLATLLLYPVLKKAGEWFVDAVILRRPDYDLLRAQIGAVVQAEQEVDGVLDGACRTLAPALNARVALWREVDAVPSVGRRSPSAAIIEIPVVEAPHYAVDFSELAGGRRLLSDDYAFLDAVAAQIGRRIDGLRMTRERYARQMREQQMAQLATEAELRALRAQINPHFLFNALTTIGYLIQTSPHRALRTLMRLTSLLRAVLRSDGEFTTVERELDLIEAYLDIERARFEQRLRVEIDVPATVRNTRIPALILQPLVENAIKHGIARTELGGAVIVTGRIEQASGGNVLTLSIRDTGAGATDAELRHGRSAGVGLSNVERRLAGHYGDRATLRVTSRFGEGTTVDIRMPAELRGAAPAGERSA
ncbi:MAG TPA: sensor histidine kinase [Vicinamibacterales bacterium]|jgi:signal transduction histidine kinase|nr:sensor histidine kinase [Vicinamibacterales bacterium]